MPVRVKRVYERAEKSDGVRILVDRLWPRGLSKESAQIDEWLKEVAPSHELRKCFGHRPERWIGFCRRYWKELQTFQGKESFRRLKSIARKKVVTLLFGAKDINFNNARALRQFLRRPRRN